ncbi:ABC transporter ATP-binding protein [Lapidilactobacillus bayanensis]|uniref:ABC transporter ATP-binding protein n=1 Tax=Lapidilactobacillus bayanensis TaxID=2485998 RepID=UPI000F773014|nr:ABC transporter ATP-binding protein [Lapidilactobacillus bayanensis]
MLKVENLSFAFKNKPILSDVNFTINNGVIIGLVAPNGTGKTTLLRLLSGLLPHGAARLTLNTYDQQKQRTKYLNQMFFIESSNHLYQDLTAKDHLLYVKAMWHSSIDVQQVINELGMTSYYKVKIKNMSLGMKQHVILAMYLVSNAQMLLIDEPLNGLDPTSIQLFEQIFKELRQQGKSLLVSSHQMDSVGRICDVVYFLHDQKIQPLVNTGQDMMAEYMSIFLQRPQEQEAGDERANQV